MIPYQQSPTTQSNPLLARNIDETVNNLKNLEICIDQLRNDLVQVAESTGNVPAAQRLRTPAHQAAASPASGAWAPWDIQRQLASPLASPFAATPMGPFDPYETATNPYAASAVNAMQQSPVAGSIHASNPWAQQAQLQAQRQVELERQAAMNPWAQASVAPWAIGSQVPFGAQTPFAHTQVPQVQSPYAQQNPWARQTQVAPQTVQNPYAASITQTPFAATQTPFAQQTPYRSQLPMTAPHATRHVASPVGSSIGPF